MHIVELAPPDWYLMQNSLLFPFDNSYARLPERFFARLPPTPVSEPGLVRLNESLALHLGLSPEN